MAAVRMEAPSSVLIPMAQHIGAPASVTVKLGDTVFVGTVIGEAAGFVSAPVHSSVSGTVKKIESYLMQNGRTADAVLIESDGKMTPDPDLVPPVVTSFKELSEAARKAGLIGLGGAGFPTSVKLDANKLSTIDTLVINAAECEPYITSDTRTMLDDSEWVKSGIELVAGLGGIDRVIFGIEENKPECIEKMKEIFESDSRVRVDSLPSLYPQGGEKILIFNTTGRVVPEGKLPSDVGVIVMNVTTLAFLAKYVKTGMPLVEKCVTVDGSAVKEPKNLIVPVGASLSSVFEATGGIDDGVGKVIMGGPMMGNAVYSLDAPVMKNTNAVLAFSEGEAKLAKSTPCIHCGRCVAICPMGLNPTVYAKSMNISDKEDRAARLNAAKINLCIECGSCSYVCPAKRPLVENNRLSKAFLRELGAEKKKS